MLDLHRQHWRPAPLGLAALGFCVAIFTYLNPLILPDAFGRDVQYNLRSDTVIVLLSFSLFLIAQQVVLRMEPKARGPSLFRIPNAVFYAVFIPIPIVSLVNYIRLGGVPLMVLSGSIDGWDQVGYGDVFVPFFTPVAWGCTRALAILLSILVLQSDLNRGFLRKHKGPILITICAIGFGGMDGMRNLILLPCFTIFIALSARGWIRRRWIVLIGIVAVALFVGIGKFRTSHVRQAERINLHTDYTFVNEAVAWLYLYAEPTVDNLNNLFECAPKPAYGLVTMSLIVPDKLIPESVAIPPSTAEYMGAYRLYARPGLTFRTVFADFTPDFGQYGALLVVALLTALYGLAERQKGSTIFSVVIWLGFAPAIFFMPWVNGFLSMQALLPLLVTAVVMVVYRERSMSVPTHKPLSMKSIREAGVS